MNLLRFPKLDLPVLPEGTPIVSPYDAHRLPEDQTSFVRTVGLEQASHELGLRATLRIADRGFNALVDQINSKHRHIGAIVVPHTWGLLEVSDEQIEQDAGFQSQQGIVPKGLALVTEVARVLPDMSHGRMRHSDGYKNSMAIKRVISDTHKKRRIIRSETVASDMSLRQFMHGSLAGTADSMPVRTSAAINTRQRRATEAAYQENTTILVDIEPRLAHIINRGKHKQQYIRHTSQ